MSARTISQRPYFLRACYEWITASGMTPQIIVNVEAPGVVVPGGYATGGRMVLNIGAQATKNLKLGNEALEFDARFGASVFHVYVPVIGVLGIYARESGEGLAFGEEDSLPSGSGDADRPAGGRHRLKVVK